MAGNRRFSLGRDFCMSQAWCLEDRGMYRIGCFSKTRGYWLRHQLSFTWQPAGRSQVPTWSSWGYRLLLITRDAIFLLNLGDLFTVSSTDQALVSK